MGLFVIIADYIKNITGSKTHFTFIESKLC